MTEEEPKEEEKQEEGDDEDETEEDDEAEEKTASDVIQETRDAAKELQRQNEIMKKNLERADRHKAEEIISGRSGAGKTKTKVEETPKEYAARVMKGDVSVKA